MTFPKFNPLIYALGLAVLMVILFFLTLISADHRIHSYYLEWRQGRSCVIGERAWWSNVTSYCSEDIQKVEAVKLDLEKGLARR